MLFQGLSDDQLIAAKPHLYPKSFDRNEVIMKEGEEGSFAFLVDEGVVSVRKDELKLSEIHSGNVVGLMSLIDENPRSATVYAGENGTKGFGIGKEGWNEIIQNKNSSIATVLLTNYLKYQQEAVRNTNVIGLNEARGRFEEEKKRVMSAHFFAQMVLGMVIFTFILGYLSDLADQTETTYVSFVLLGAYAIWSFIMCGIPVYP